MQVRLLQYYTKHSGLFLSNFKKALTGFDPDAIHDMRVAVKRLRAVYLLLERLFGTKSEPVSDVGRFRELFRLSGRMRDIQVQQQLIEAYATDLGTSFREYAEYLEFTEKKAIHKFEKYIKETDAEAEVKQIQKKVENLIALTNDTSVRQEIIGFVDELMAIAKEKSTDQEHDENLHEIRRKLKQCHYLLTIFDKSDPDLPHLSKTIHRLDKINELLGSWHDQQVAMEMLARFLEKRDEKPVVGENRYDLLMENLSAKRHLLNIKIKTYLEKKLDF